MHQPFYIGESVVAVDALQGSAIKNGIIYKVYSCDYAECKGKWFWYVGVQREGYKSHDRVRPSIFASMNKAVMMTFMEISEQQPVHAN